MSDLYDIDAAAAYLGIARGTWITHRKRGNAPQPAGKIGRSPYWTREQLDKWANERPGRPGRPPGHKNVTTNLAGSSSSNAFTLKECDRRR